MILYCQEELTDHIAVISFNRFDIFFQVIGDFFQAGQAAISGNGIDHDRQFGNIHLEYRRIIFKVLREILFGLIHLILDLLEDLVDIRSGDKFHVDHGDPFRADGMDFFNPVQPFQFFLNGNGDGCLDIR